MEAEQFSEACPLLEQSYKLDPKAGTLFTLANCRDLEGKIASASARYGEYLRLLANMPASDQQKHTTRASMAEARVHELSSRLPTLVVKWSGVLPPQAKIFVDDLELGRQAPALPLPLDPGPHEITVQQTGEPNTQRTIFLEIAQSKTFDVDTEVSLVKPKVEVIAPRATAPPIEIPKIQYGPNPRKLAGFITLGVGGASLVFGGVMGALALSEKQLVDAHCAGSTGIDCDTTGFSAAEKMRAYATPSTAAIIAGSILTTAGVVLVLTAPKVSKEKPTALRLRASGGFIGMEGKF